MSFCGKQIKKKATLKKSRLIANSDRRDSLIMSKQQTALVNSGNFFC